MKRFKNGKFLPILKERRELAGYTQKEVARILNVSQPNISKWETGKSFPGYPGLKMLSELYGCTIDQLYIFIRDK